jgi:hypothetical protein
MILALCSTLARLLVGVTADILAPPLTAVPAPQSSISRYTDNDSNIDDPEAVKPPTHIWVRKDKVRLTRSAYAALCAVVLAGVFALSAGELESESGLWILSGGTGVFYGALFTLLVSWELYTEPNMGADEGDLACYRVGAFWTYELWFSLGHGIVFRCGRRCGIISEWSRLPVIGIGTHFPIVPIRPALCRYSGTVG